MYLVIAIAKTEGGREVLQCVDATSAPDRRSYNRQSHQGNNNTELVYSKIVVEHPIWNVSTQNHEVKDAKRV